MVDEGALVVSVMPESAAEAAGLQEGDVITQVDGRAVAASHPLDEHIRRYRPGDRVELTVLRDGRERDISVELGARRDMPPVSPMRDDDQL
jgi:S1-C subfamily serine protease